MYNSGFTSSEVDFSQSQVSQLSKYNFEMQNLNNFEADQTVINNTISEGCDSLKQFDDNVYTQQKNHSKRLYMKDLQVNKENSQKPKLSNKQNNIPNQTINETYTQSRKIIIHKNPSISPYRMPVDESFTTNKIVNLQEELISLRKQMGFKESGWIKEKSMMMSKMEMASFQVAQMKQRNNNLIQINQTLTQALGQTSKSQVLAEYEKRIQETNRELILKNKKIMTLQQQRSRMQKDKIDQITRQKQDKERIQYLTVTLEEYKLLVKQSNERKFQSDERMVNLGRHIELIKVKLNQLPIKNQYLNPIFALLNNLKQGTYCDEQTRARYEDEQRFYDRPQQSGNQRKNQQIQNRFQFSQIKKTHQRQEHNHKNNQFIRGNNYKAKTNNNKVQESFINQINDITTNRLINQLDNINFSSNNYYSQANDQEESNDLRESDIYQRNNRQLQSNLSYNTKDQQPKYTNAKNHHANKQNPINNRKKNTFNNLLFDKQHVKRIDTSQDQYQDYQPYNNNNISNNPSYLQQQPQQQDQQQVYLCQVCHRVYPHQQFLNHMKQCQQYEALIQHKKLIESKLISINQIDYQNRKSHLNSLNSSAIVLNKSRSKTKIVKHIQNPIMTGRPSNTHNNRQNHREASQYNAQRADHIAERRDHITERGNYTNRKENLTERYINREQNDDSSRIQLSELMNISGISSRPSYLNHKDNNSKRQPKGMPANNNNKRFIPQNQYYTSQMNKNNESNQDSSFYNSPSPLNYKYKEKSQLKYQTNMPTNNNVGKESMQEEIRKIVQAINEGKSSKNRPDSYSNKHNNNHQNHQNHQNHNNHQNQHNQSRIESNRKQLISKTNKNKPQFY